MFRIIILAVAIVTGASGFAHALNLSMDPANAIAQADSSTFGIDLNVSGLDTTDLSAYDISVIYDPNLFTFVGATFGGELGGPAFSLSGDDRSVPGEVIVEEFSFIDPFDDFFLLQPDAFTLATLNFSARAVGVGAFEYGFTLLGDAFAEELTVDSFTGAEVTAVPEPATMILASMGLLGIGLRARRRK